MARAPEAIIDLGALRLNLARVRRAAPRSRIVAVIKADGYGHGIVPVAQALEGADAFGVACLEEALALRCAGISAPILLLEGVFAARELTSAAEQRLTVVVHMEEQIAMLEGVRFERPLEVWVKVDTGMHRLGFEPQTVPQALGRLRACPQVARVRGLMTHLACADELDHPLTARQWACLESLAEGQTGELSVANSAAILGWPGTHAEWVRPGIMLYGASPFPDRVGAEHGLAPVMTLSSNLMAVRQCRRGQAIGYGASWTCPEDMAVGVVSIGYGDGYPRHAPPGTPVLLRGRRALLIGRVSMDMLHVDLRGHPDARLGDPVVLWGQGLPVEVVARQANTISYELLCQVTRRVPRRLVEGKETSGALEAARRAS
jgi:alanine racemase